MEDGTSDFETAPASGFWPLLRTRLGGLFSMPPLDRRFGALAAVLGLVLWSSTGIYKVQPDEQGVILRFGKWIGTTGPGLHFHLPWPVDTVLFPRITQINQLQLGAVPGAGPVRFPSQMLTGDENIVEADCAVFWQVSDAGLYLFKVADPAAALKTDAESALREVIARTPIQAALSDKRQQIADQTRTLLQSLLDTEQTGIRVVQIQLQRIDPPAAVIDAFNDVQRARADQERARNEADAYANDILPRARGDAEHVRQEAEAYKAQVVDLAQGEARNFTSVYQSYALAKGVTSWRLYLEGIDEVLKKSGKVIVDTSGKNVGAITPFMPLADARPGPVPFSDPRIPGPQAGGLK